MKLATVRIEGETALVRIDRDEAVRLPLPDVGALLALEDWQQWAASAEGSPLSLDSLVYAPLILRPGKIICVGLNYRSHILESGLPIPEFPVLFAKFPEALIGARDDVRMPPESAAVDWEAELAVVIGRSGRRIGASDAARHIAGYSVFNDISIRDWQLRTSQWLPGKTFEATTPLGPWLVTDDGSGRYSGEIVCEVDGEMMQQAHTDDLVFHPADLVAFISTIVTLSPGDVIATGTPGGVGGARNPKRYLRPGETVITRIDGLGECRNTCVPEPATHLVSASA